MHQHTPSKGFSLIEMMITTVIIGILATIAIPIYQTYIKKAQLIHLVQSTEKAKVKLAEYIAATRDTNCSQPTFQTAVSQVSADPRIDAGVNAIYINGERVCIAVALQWDYFGPVTYISIGYVPTTNSDGSIDWQCRVSMYFPGGSASLGELLPENCQFF